MSNPTDSIEKLLRTLTVNTGDEYYKLHSGKQDFAKTNSRMEFYEARAKAAIESLIQAARIDENESILSVAQHEIDLPDHCEMHDRFAAACHACKKRKWYGEISKDWKRVINIRLKELEALNNIGDTE